MPVRSNFLVYSPTARQFLCPWYGEILPIKTKILPATGGTAPGHMLTTCCISFDWLF
jgi:hypothetical protein